MVTSPGSSGSGCSQRSCSPDAGDPATVLPVALLPEGEIRPKTRPRRPPGRVLRLGKPKLSCGTWGITGSRGGLRRGELGGAGAADLRGRRDRPGGGGYLPAEPSRRRGIPERRAGGGGRRPSGGQRRRERRLTDRVGEPEGCGPTHPPLRDGETSGLSEGPKLFVASEGEGITGEVRRMPGRGGSRGPERGARPPGRRSCPGDLRDGGGRASGAGYSGAARRVWVGRAGVRKLTRPFSGEGDRRGRPCCVMPPSRRGPKMRRPDR